MTALELFTFKERLIKHCTNLLASRIQHSIDQMHASQEAANEEGKSSAGDKYETSRAMNQLDKDMYARQLLENRQELAAFLSFASQQPSASVQPGSLVSCEKYFFFVAGGIGKMQFEGNSLLIISPRAPIAQQLIGKRVGDRFKFNNQEFEILAIN